MESLKDVENFISSFAKISKSSFQFKELATKLMTRNTPSMYEKAVKDINDYIESKSKRLFLRGFVNFWNPHRRNFYRTFKYSNVPKTNLNENYHSSYVTGHKTSLTLLDAAYRDTAAAISLGRSLELFREGFKCQGAGPTQKETIRASARHRKAR